MNPLHVKLGAAALAILIVGAAGGYWLAQRTEPEDAGATPHGDRKVLYWHDPMVPNARFDKPGKSPFMDMQLVPVYADETGGGAVPVDPVVSQNLGIRLMLAECCDDAHEQEVGRLVIATQTARQVLGPGEEVDVRTAESRLPPEDRRERRHR